MRGLRIRAGDLDRRIAFKRPVSPENGFGEPVTNDFTLLANTRASVSYGTGRERREAGIEGNDLPATFRTRKSSINISVTTKDIIEFEGVIWDISSIVPFGDVGLDFTAVRRLL